MHVFVYNTHIILSSNYQKIAVQRMTSAKETQCQTILHLWNQGITNGKEKRVQWARQLLNDNWTKTLFSDETAFQLFRNTLKRWHKGERPIHPVPKDRTKIFAWGGFCVKGKTSLFCFKQIMDANFYVKI